MSSISSIASCLFLLLGHHLIVLSLLLLCPLADQRLLVRRLRRCRRCVCLLLLASGWPSARVCAVSASHCCAFAAMPSLCVVLQRRCRRRVRCLQLTQLLPQLPVPAPTLLPRLLLPLR